MKIQRLKLVAVPTLIGALALPLAASAQAPSYAARAETITGTIASVQNVNHIFVDDDRGYTDDVTLRSGASVFSNGVRLEPGERVTIQGSAAGPTFLASRISTDGRTAAAAQTYVAAPVAYPVPAYYPAPVYYPYYPGPYYGYAYGLSIGIGFGGYRGYGGYGGYHGFGGGGYHGGFGGGGYHGGFGGGGVHGGGGHR
jgi:hypothetical protein